MVLVKSLPTYTYIVAGNTGWKGETAQIFSYNQTHTFHLCPVSIIE